MKKYMFICIGGFIGAILRYLIKSINTNSRIGAIPLSTLAINISGVFLLAFISGMAIKVWKLDTDYHLGLTVGFLGAFTTFSAMCKEIAGMLREGFYLSTLVYISVSVILGFSAAYFGMILTDYAASKYTRKRKDVK